ncbi:hypothetical protein LTR33_000464 [Friedmanniomyces endolithicus]|nr:hypothetical protein LTR33_000464 [Friedmanniomyces endolithicus]
MASTIATTLARPINNAIIIGYDVNATTSTKNWTTGFDLQEWDVEGNTVANYLDTNNSGPLDPVDHKRLSLSALLPMARETVRTEAEVGAHFQRYIDYPVSLGWSTFPALLFRHALAPPAPFLAGSAMTVDVMVTHPSTGEALVIGEYKKPGVVRAAEWREEADVSNRTQKLANELLGQLCLLFRRPESMVL